MICSRLCASLVSLLLMLPLLSGCDSEDDVAALQRDLARSRARAEADERKSPQVPRIPELEVVVPFVFDLGARRNPFLPDQRGDLLAEDLLRPDPTRPKEVPGEFHDLDGMSMVGYLQWEEQNEQAALIRLPKRQSRIVKDQQNYGSPDRRIDLRRVGHYLGTNNGRIRQISEAAIDIVELDRNERGVYYERERQLPLKDTPRSRLLRYETGIYLDEDGIYRQQPGVEPEAQPGLQSDSESGMPEAGDESTQTPVTNDAGTEVAAAEPDAVETMPAPETAESAITPPALPTNDGSIQGVKP